MNSHLTLLQVEVPGVIGFDLRFQAFDLEGHYNQYGHCDSDTLAFYTSEKGDTFTLKATYCGERESGTGPGAGTLRVEGVAFLLRFSSDHLLQRRGFNLTWEAVRAASVSCGGRQAPDCAACPEATNILILTNQPTK